MIYIGLHTEKIKGLKMLPYTKSAALFPPSLLCCLGWVTIFLQIPWRVMKTKFNNQSKFKLIHSSLSVQLEEHSKCVAGKRKELITIVSAFFGTECATSLGISTSFAINLYGNHVAVEVSFKKSYVNLTLEK